MAIAVTNQAINEFYRFLVFLKIPASLSSSFSPQRHVQISNEMLLFWLTNCSFLTLQLESERYFKTSDLYVEKNVFTLRIIIVGIVDCSQISSIFSATDSKTLRFFPGPAPSFGAISNRMTDRTSLFVGNCEFLNSNCKHAYRVNYLSTEFTLKFLFPLKSIVIPFLCSSNESPQFSL